MNPVLKAILLVVGGYILGTIVHMGLLMLGNVAIPPPDGVNPIDPVSLKENFHLFTGKHFIFPYLAHQSGGIVGSFLIGKLGGLKWQALLIGACFMAGGIYMATSLPQPTWFSVLDIVSYLPGALVGYKLGTGSKA